MTVRPPIKRRMEAGLTDYLLDYDQEGAVKRRDLESRFARLEGRLSENIEWRTFNEWCCHHCPQKPAWRDLLKMAARQRLVNEFWHTYLKNTTISSRMFKSEIDWLKDQLPMSLDDYLKADRRGRGFGLTSELRRRVFDALLGYQKALQSRHALDWGDIPRQMCPPQFTPEHPAMLKVLYDVAPAEQGRVRRFYAVWDANILGNTLLYHSAIGWLNPVQALRGRHIS